MKATLFALIAALTLTSADKLVIKDTKVGTGPAAQPGDILTMDYTGKLTNGKQFDSSIGREPFVFVLGAGQVIKGWDQGMVGMKKGGKRSLTIPSSLGYGAQGAGDDIPPNSTLKFDVTMIKIGHLNVKITKKGSGPGATGGDACALNYELKDAAGKKIDSSYDRKQTFDIVLGQTQLVKGFTAAVVGMKQGEKRHVEIPAEYGYGDRGAGSVIKPGQTLYFDIEMVKLTHGGAH